ncbi:MAG: hypothetical protein ACTIN7_04460 [Lactococcus lactis]|uniref:hypothetical protein n=1 Tax=Lactococcus lactis TaxID=1358 RepID=UPI00223BA3A3|nr:hypothetical protein [Lactococcus lactis]MCT0044824.1 hypothetical protein [Lactococcus lactis subsp. lactis]
MSEPIQNKPFEETAQYIQKLFIERINKRKGKKTFYQVLGYNQKTAFELGGGNDNEISKLSKIFSGKINPNELDVKLLTDKLGFDSAVELLWGTEEERKSYSREIFILMFIEMFLSADPRFGICKDLLQIFDEGDKEGKISKIYDLLGTSMTINGKKNAWNKFDVEFNQLISAEAINKKFYDKNGKSVKILGKNSSDLVDYYMPKKYSDTVSGEFMGFKKFDSVLQDFLEKRIIPSLMGVYIELTSDE